MNRKIRNKKVALAVATLIASSQILSIAAGATEIVTKTGVGAVYSNSVSSSIGIFDLYVSASGNSSSNVNLTVYYRDGVNASYAKYPGYSLSVDHGESAKGNVDIGKTFAKIKLSGLGKGTSKITSR